MRKKAERSAGSPCRVGLKVLILYVALRPEVAPFPRQRKKKKTKSPVKNSMPELFYEAVRSSDSRLNSPHPLHERQGWCELTNAGMRLIDQAEQ